MSRIVVVRGVNRRHKVYFRSTHKVPAAAEKPQICALVYEQVKGTHQEVHNISVQKHGRRSAYIIEAKDFEHSIAGKRGSRSEKVPVEHGDIEKPAGAGPANEVREPTTHANRSEDERGANAASQGHTTRAPRPRRRTVVVRNDGRNYEATHGERVRGLQATLEEPFVAELRGSTPQRVHFAAGTKVEDSPARQVTELPGDMPTFELPGDYPVEWSRRQATYPGQKLWQARM